MFNFLANLRGKGRREMRGGAAGERPGDAWEPQARQMLDRPLAKIQMDGCMGETENVRAVGRCIAVQRVPDAASPETRVIWVALGRTPSDESFRVIVANCRWNAERGRFEERY